MLHEDWPAVEGHDFLEVAEMLRRKHGRLSEKAMAANLHDDAEQHDLLCNIFSALTADLAAEIDDPADQLPHKIDAVMEHPVAGLELRADLNEMVRQVRYNEALWLRMQE